MKDEGITMGIREGIRGLHGYGRDTGGERGLGRDRKG